MLRASQTDYWRLRVASRTMYVKQLVWTTKNFHSPPFLHHLLSALSQQYLIYIVNSFHGLTGPYQQSSHLPKPNSNRTSTAGLHFIQPTDIVTIYLDYWPCSNVDRVTKRAYWIACNFPPFLQEDSENVSQHLAQKNSVTLPSLKGPLIYIKLFFYDAAAQRGPWPPHSRGFLITHNDAPHSIGFLWTSDQLVAETSTWQHTTLTTDKHPCPWRDSNPQTQQKSGRRPTP